MGKQVVENLLQGWFVISHAFRILLHLFLLLIRATFVVNLLSRTPLKVSALLTNSFLSRRMKRSVTTPRLLRCRYLRQLSLVTDTLLRDFRITNHHRRPTCLTSTEHYHFGCSVKSQDLNLVFLTRFSSDRKTKYRAGFVCFVNTRR